MLSKIVNYIKTNIIKNKNQELKQTSCQHEWEYPYDEEHGVDRTRRTCIKCNQQRYIVYYKYGMKRYEWKII